MSMNVVILQGRFPASDKFDFKYIQGEEGGKRSYFRGTLSVDQNFVQKGQKYPDSDLINIRAFGQVADRIAKFFRPGDNILINGQLRHDKPYQDESGQTHQGSLYVIVDNFQFQYANEKHENNSVGQQSVQKQDIPSPGSMNPFANMKAPIPEPVQQPQTEFKFGANPPKFSANFLQK